jgi:hypothetical protein
MRHLTGRGAGERLTESGSETRQRPVQHTVRFTYLEDALLRTYADQAGVSIAAWLRSTALNAPLPRAVRRPTSSHEDVARLLAELGRVTTAFREATDTRMNPCDVETALRDLSEMRLLCFNALGRKP